MFLLVVLFLLICHSPTTLPGLPFAKFLAACGLLLYSFLNELSHSDYRLDTLTVAII